jgi:hypothetical protein
MEKKMGRLLFPGFPTLPKPFRQRERSLCRVGSLLEPQASFSE